MLKLPNCAGKMMRRIIVIRTTGSGKTTTAREIARRLRIPHVELDALNWGPNWTEAPREVFRQRRLFRRTIARTLTQEELWSGNRERVRTAFLSRDSIFLWALQTYRRRRQSYPLLLSRPEHAHLTVVRLRSPRAVASWVDALGQAPLR